MLDKLNLGNSLFEGFNDKRGVMLCGYEFGESSLNKDVDSTKFNTHATFTFFDKSPKFNNVLHAPYDDNIKKWVLKLWDLNNPVIPSFDKYFIQTNLAVGSQNKKSDFDAYKANDESFIEHLSCLEPSIIIFFGSELAHHFHRIKQDFRINKILGNETESKKVIQHDIKSENGKFYRRFKITFFTFDKCRVVVFPNAGGARGIADAYISSFKDEMKSIFSFRFD